MAQNSQAQVGPSRVPIMSASTLEARTRPSDEGQQPIWLRHRMQRRHMTETTSAPRRAREWFNRLARRGPVA